MEASRIDAKMTMAASSGIKKKNTNGGKIPCLKLTVRTWKLMVGILVSFWDGLFSGGYVSFREDIPTQNATV